jgi:hypothetical protein
MLKPPTFTARETALLQAMPAPQFTTRALSEERAKADGA